MQLILMTVIFAPIVLGILIYAMDRVTISRGVFLLQVLLTVAVVGLIHHALPELLQGTGILVTAGGWSPHAGIEFRLDRVSFLFTLMTVLAFWYVYLYVWWSRKGDHKFLFFLSMLQGAMLALFMVNDLFSMFVLIEFITITCSILITYKKDGVSVKAGLYYLLYNSLSMLLFLLGVIYLYVQVGTVNLSLLTAALPSHMDTAAYRWAILLILSAFCLKSAIVPLSSWLPLAHASAPASVSALLSGLVVKSGLFILLRLGALAFIPGVRELLLGLGIASGLFGAAMAFLQTDIKRILAYHTISQVGLIVIGLSSPGAAPELGALAHIFNHFLFKSLLFLGVGAVITWTGERNVHQIRGVYRRNRVLGVSLGIGILGITGAPFFNGSISKALIAASASGFNPGPLVFVINLLTLLSFAKFSAILTGGGDEKPYPADARVVAPMFLAVMVLVSYPLELFLLGTLPEVQALTGASHRVMELLKYGATLFGAFWLYGQARRTLPALFHHFDRPTYHFQRGVGVLFVFLAGLTVILL